MRILVVEDDPRTLDVLTQALTGAGYLVEHTGEGEEAWFLGDTEPYAAVILDLGLKGMDGLAVLKRWRAAGRDLPVLKGWRREVFGADAVDLIEGRVSLALAGDQARLIPVTPAS